MPGGERVVKGVPDERMGEGHPARNRRHLDHDPRGDRVIEDPEERVPREAARLVEDVQAELPSEDRRQGQDTNTLFGQTSQATFDDLAYLRGDRDPERGRIPKSL